MKNFSIAMILLLTACGGGSKPAARPDSPTTNTATATTADPMLGLAEIKIYNHDQAGIQIHADGRIETLSTKAGTSGWETFATITSDGTITGIDHTHAGSVQPDGSFKTSDGQVLPLKLDGDALVIKDKRVTIDDAGAVIVNGQPTPGVRVEGATAAKTRRTALLVFALVVGMLGHGEVHAE